MTDIASLGIEVKTDSVKSAASDLDKLNQAGAQAEQSVKKVGQSFSEAGNNARGLATAGQAVTQSVNQVGAANRTAAQSGAELVAALKEQVALFGKSSEDVLRYKAGLVGVQHSVEPLIQQLQELAVAEQAAAKAAAEEAAVFAAVQQAQTALSTSQYNFLEGLREQAALFGKSSTELLEYEARMLGVSNSAAPLIRSLQEQKTAQAAAAKAAADEAEAQRQASIAKQTAESQQRSFLANLREQAELQGKSRADILEYRATQLGVGDQASQYIKQIRDFEAANNRSNESLKNGALSAGQYKQALALLPAQFTDIAVGLSTGQSPFTVLLQQGGQLRDAFGGVGPAVAEIGRYAVGLVTPFTLAAAALAALAVAYKQGSDEQTAYAKALILTGNAAGVTTDQLADLARQVGSETGTIHDAADALTQFAATGKFASSQLGELATAALNFEDATGKAVSETVKEFARLADDPVKASQQLNEQYHYLTAAVYEQITALEKQGNTEEAAALAQKAYADALRDRSTQVIQSLGYIETAWKNIKEGAASAWDAMLGVGREQTPQQRLEELNKPAGFDQKGFFSSGAMFGPLGALYNSYKQFDAATTPEDDRRQEKVFLEQQLATKEAIARAEGNYREEQEKGLAAQREVDAMETRFLTNAQKRNKEIEKYRRQIEEIRKANPNDARLDEDRIAKNIANIEAEYKDPKAPKTPKTKAYQDDEATRLLLSLQQQEASLSEQLNIDTKLSESKKQQIKFEQLIADLKTKDILTADQKSLLANQDAISAQLEKNSQLDAEITKRKELLKLQSFKGGLDQTLQSDAQGYEESRAGEGLGKLQRQELRDRLRIQREYQRQVFQLQTQQGSISTDLMDKETKALEDNLNKRLKLNEDHYSQLAEDQQSFAKGASDAFSEYLDNARDIAGATKDIVGDTMNSFTQGVSDSIGRAIVQGDNLRDSLANVAQTIETQLISALVQLGVQYAVNASIGQSVGAAATAASATMAAATAVAWAPAAALASLASFGGNAAPAAVALTGTATLAESIAAASALGGFYTGGFTGSGSPFDVAGVVHKGEYVMTADTVNRLGVDNLDAIQKGRSIASAVPAANDPSIGSSGRSGAPSSSKVTNINVNVTGIRDSVDLRQASAKVARDVIGAVSHAERYS